MAGLHNSDSYGLKTFQSLLNLAAHILIGTVVGAVVVFASQLPSGATRLHIFLCATGVCISMILFINVPQLTLLDLNKFYQLLMSEAIMALSANNGWSKNLRMVDMRRAHWILQVLGSGLALAGSIVKFIDKDEHFTTLHGKFALVAVIFTVLSLVNGLVSLYAYEWRKVLPVNVTKISHICFGIIAYLAASLSLCYGFDKLSFKNWASPAIAYTCIAFTAAFTFIILINPSITFFNKSRQCLKK